MGRKSIRVSQTGWLAWFVKERRVSKVHDLVECVHSAQCNVQYLFAMIKCIDNVIGQTGEQVNDKPTLQVVHSDYLWIGHHLTTRANECCVEVEHNVYEKYYVYDAGVG